MPSRVRPRVLLIAFIALVLLDVALRAAYPVAAPRYYRMPDRTLAGYDRLVASAAEATGARVAVVGDSIIYGTFALPPDTLPSHLTDVLEEKGLRARAYNLGLSGAHAVDFLPLVADLLEEDAADIIVLDFDYRFFNENASLTRRYPGLYERVEETGVVSGDQLFTPSDEATRSFESVVSDGVGRVWELYGAREYLASALLGGVPKRASELKAQEWRASLAGRAAYSKRPAARIKPDGVKKAFDVPPFDSGNPHLARLALLLDAAEAQGIEVVVFAGPVDTALLDEKGWWDREDYDANLVYVRRLVEDHGGTWLEYTDAVPSAEIADTHHPLSAGYRRLAEYLVRDIRPQLDAAIARRSGSGDDQ